MAETGSDSYNSLMRAAPGVHVEWVEDEAVILDSLTGQLHYLNPAAALFYALVQEYGFDKALERIETEYEAGTPFRDGLRSLLDDMKEKGLLIDD